MRTAQAGPLRYPGLRYEVRAYGSAPIHGDFDGDGNQDLITCGQYGIDPCHMHLGDGAGGFTPSPWRPMDRIEQVVAGDFDKDGRDDIAALVKGSVQILRSDGMGGFAPPVTLDSGGGQPGRRRGPHWRWQAGSGLLHTQQGPCASGQRHRRLRPCHRLLAHRERNDARRCEWRWQAGPHQPRPGGSAEHIRRQWGRRLHPPPHGEPLSDRMVDRDRGLRSRRQSRYRRIPHQRAYSSARGGPAAWRHPGSPRLYPVQP